MKKVIKTNLILVDLINKLKQKKKPFWKTIAELLAKPRKQMVVVNLSKLEKYCNEKSVVVVPGKVLGDGKLSKNLTVSAFKFSSSAEKSIKENGGKIMSLSELINSKTEPKDITLVR